MADRMVALLEANPGKADRLTGRVALAVKAEGPLTSATAASLVKGGRGNAVCPSAAMAACLAADTTLVMW